MYVMIHTITDFEKNPLIHWYKDHTFDKDYVNKTFHVLCSCLQGEAATEWGLCVAKFQRVQHTKKNFVLVQCTNLGN